MAAASSPAPGGPACEHCLVPNKVAAVAAGSMGELAGRACYVAKGSGSAAVVVITDVFGHSFVNCQAVADAIALASGATVFVPDVLEGDAIPPDGFDRATFPAWRERHTDAAVVPLAQAAVAALRAKGYTRIGSIGYCFGARHSVLLARAKLIDCYAVAHPSFTSTPDYAGLEQPALFLCAETDQAFVLVAARNLVRVRARRETGSPPAPPPRLLLPNRATTPLFQARDRRRGQGGARRPR